MYSTLFVDTLYINLYLFMEHVSDFIHWYNIYSMYVWDYICWYNMYISICINLYLLIQHVLECIHLFLAYVFSLLNFAHFFWIISCIFNFLSFCIFIYNIWIVLVYRAIEYDPLYTCYRLNACMNIINAFIWQLKKYRNNTLIEREKREAQDENREDIS